ncbi:MAG: SGNH/GDSL hydrolase family protein [Kiritimatiellae bacterium]|nr:SGNH/GDSL hydrolase family protein [Kiritimatiellia bacterium]
MTASEDTGATIWYDGALLTVEGKGWQATESFYDRLPAKAKGMVPDGVWGLSRASAGICIRFATDASSLQVRWSLTESELSMHHMPATGKSGVDLYGRDPAGNWTFLGNGRALQMSNTASFETRSASECLLYLPLYNGVTAVAIGISKDNRLAPPPASVRDRRKPIVFYGTSITQGGCASRPGLAYTAIVGRKLDVPVINLGFSGSARMEPELADLLAELDPSVYVIDSLWNMSPAQVAERIEPCVRKLRRAHPETPILLAEDSNVWGTTPTEKGRVLRSVHEKLTSEGIKRLAFLSNEEMLETDGEGTVDGCHPNDLGMMRHAAAFVKALSGFKAELGLR